MLVPALPWLCVLALLALRNNRHGSAWWLWVPLIISALLMVWAGTRQQTFGPVVTPMFEPLAALSFGLATLWAVAGYLDWKHRFVTFLAMLSAIGVPALVVVIVGQGFSGGSQTIVGIIIASVSTPLIAAALSLAGFACRKQYKPMRLTVLLLLACLLCAALILSPICVITALSRSAPNWHELLGVIVALGSLGFGITLPFLVLSFSNRFYRERLKGLLHLGEPPCAAANAPAIVPESIQAALTDQN